MTYEEYVDTIVIPFREAMLNGEDVEWVCVTTDVTCHTTGCIADGRPIRMNVAENLDGVYRVSCGGCQEAATDLFFWGYNGEAFTT